MNRRLTILSAVLISAIAIAGFLLRVSSEQKKYVVTHEWKFKMGDGKWNSEHNMYGVDTSSFWIAECEERGWRVRVKVSGNPDSELMGFSIYREGTLEKIWSKHQSGFLELERIFDETGEFYFVIVGGAYSTQVEISVEEWKTP